MKLSAIVLFVAAFALALCAGTGCMTDAKVGSAVADALGSDPVPTTVSGCNLDIAQANVDLEKLNAELAKVEADTSISEDNKAESRKALQAQIKYLEMRIVRDKAIIDSLTADANR